MSQGKSVMSGEELDDLEKKIRTFHDYHNEMKTELGTKRVEDGLNIVELSQQLGWGSPRVVEHFFSGKSAITGGQRLDSLLQYLEYDEEIADVIRDAAQDLPDRFTGFISLDKAEIDAVMLIFRGYYLLPVESDLTSDEFGEIFDPNRDEIAAILNGKADKARRFFDDKDFAKGCLNILSDPEELNKVVENATRRKKAEFEELIKTYYKLVAPYSDLSSSKASAARALGINTSTYCNWLNPSNVYRIKPLRELVEKVKAHVEDRAQPSTGIGATRIQSDSSKNGSHLQKNAPATKTDRVYENESEPDLLMRMDRSDLGELDTSAFQRELVSKVRVRAEELRLALQQLLRERDPALILHARKFLRKEMLESRDIIDVFASWADVEEILIMIRGEHEMRDLLG